MAPVYGGDRKGNYIRRAVDLEGAAGYLASRVASMCSLRNGCKDAKPEEPKTLAELIESPAHFG